MEPRPWPRQHPHALTTEGACRRGPTAPGANQPWLGRADLGSSWQETGIQKRCVRHSSSQWSSFPLSHFLSRPTSPLSLHRGGRPVGLMSVLVTQGHPQEPPGGATQCTLLILPGTFLSPGIGHQPRAETTGNLISSRKHSLVVPGLLPPGGRCSGLGLWLAPPGPLAHRATPRVTAYS